MDNMTLYYAVNFSMAQVLCLYKFNAAGMNLTALKQLIKA